MEIKIQPSQLALIVLFISCFVAETQAANSFHGGGGRGRRRPGFAYTRHRGTCTPQYWSSRTEAWPRMVPQTSTVSRVFGSRVFERFRSDVTLLESTTRNDDGENVFHGLMKEAIAALLNAYARREGYPYTAWEVKTLVIQALVSEKAAARLVKQFSVANHACN